MKTTIIVFDVTGSWEFQYGAIPTTETTIMITEKTIARNEDHIFRRYAGNGFALPFSMIGLSEFFLLISATITAPEAITTAAIIVAAGWSIVIAIL